MACAKSGGPAARRSRWLRSTPSGPIVMAAGVVGRLGPTRASRRRHRGVTAARAEQLVRRRFVSWRAARVGADLQYAMSPQAPPVGAAGCDAHQHGGRVGRGFEPAEDRKQRVERHVGRAYWACRRRCATVEPGVPGARVERVARRVRRTDRERERDPDRDRRIRSAEDESPARSAAASRLSSNPTCSPGDETSGSRASVCGSFGSRRCAHTMNAAPNDPNGPPAGRPPPGAGRRASRPPPARSRRLLTKKSSTTTPSAAAGLGSPLTCVSREARGHEDAEPRMIATELRERAGVPGGELPRSSGWSGARSATHQLARAERGRAESGHRRTGAHGLRLRRRCVEQVRCFAVLGCRPACPR
jgi:hypothetical protein